jgi:hypothetical protein
VGVHIGAGADITGGMAYGGQLDYTIGQERNAIELGLTIFAGAITEDTDTSLGTRWGNGSMQSEDGISAGAIVNFEIGTRIDEKFDLWLQVPTSFISTGKTRDGGIVPNLTIAAGVKCQAGPPNNSFRWR